MAPAGPGHQVTRVSPAPYAVTRQSVTAGRPVSWFTCWRGRFGQSTISGRSTRPRPAPDAPEAGRVDLLDRPRLELSAEIALRRPCQRKNHHARRIQIQPVDSNTPGNRLRSRRSGNRPGPHPVREPKADLRVCPATTRDHGEHVKRNIWRRVNELSHECRLSQRARSSRITSAVGLVSETIKSPIGGAAPTSQHLLQPQEQPSVRPFPHRYRERISLRQICPNFGSLAYRTAVAQESPAVAPFSIIMVTARQIVLQRGKLSPSPGATG